MITLLLATTLLTTPAPEPTCSIPCGVYTTINPADRSITTTVVTPHTAITYPPDGGEPIITILPEEK